MQIKKTILTESVTLEELKHTVTIQAHELIEERPFDTKGRYGSNDWETSELREYLNSETYAARCAELAKYAIPVTKMNTNGRKTVDTFFLLSVDEYDAKDTPYEYYKDKPYRAAKHAKDDYNDWHRTRSANRGNSYNTWCVNSSGYVTNYLAYGSMRCAPACAIG